MANPTDVFAMDDLRTIMGRNFTPGGRHPVADRRTTSACPRGRRRRGRRRRGRRGGRPRRRQPAFEIESLQSVVEDAPIVRYVNLLILQALNERASDIHIEPTPKRLRIRFRIDGVMHDATSASPAIHPAVVSRLKVLGEMDITEHRIPQEGRVSLSVSDRQIDLRLATLPVASTARPCVMRLLDKSASIRSLPELGFSADTLERYAQSYHHPYGVILVTGPTGAGKTTTLYATLQEVHDPGEVRGHGGGPGRVPDRRDHPGADQPQGRADLLERPASRSCGLDPDIVLIGEIRDIDTATIAMEAALSAATWCSPPCTPTRPPPRRCG